MYNQIVWQLHAFVNVHVHMCKSICSVYRYVKKKIQKKVNGNIRQMYIGVIEKTNKQHF